MQVIRAPRPPVPYTIYNGPPGAGPEGQPWAFRECPDRLSSVTSPNLKGVAQDQVLDVGTCTASIKVMALMQVMFAL